MEVTIHLFISGNEAEQLSRSVLCPQTLQRSGKNPAQLLKRRHHIHNCPPFLICFFPDVRERHGGVVERVKKREKVKQKIFKLGFWLDICLLWYSSSIKSDMQSTGILLNSSRLPSFWSKHKPKAKFKPPMTTHVQCALMCVSGFCVQNSQVHTKLRKFLRPFSGSTCETRSH